MDCVCSNMENILVFVDSTAEYSGVTLTCKLCLRDVDIKSVRSLQEEHNDR
jgi:hypothetical protein